MLRQRRNNIKGKPRRRQQLQPLDHLILKEPLRISFIMNEMAHPTEKRVPLEAFDGSARDVRVQQWNPPHHADDPGMNGRLLEHVLGVGITVGRLDEDGVRHTRGRELRRDLRRLERPRNRPERRHQPRIRDAIQVPGVQMGIYDGLGHGNTSE